MPHFKNFSDFMTQLFHPHFQANPSFTSIDGGVGGNRKVFATFDHAGSKWKVHSDSRFQPFDSAYKSDPTGHKSLTVANTPAENLKLVPAVGKQLGMYIYKV